MLINLHEDKYTGSYVDEANDVMISIIAYQDNNTNEISYYMTYNKNNTSMLFKNMPASFIAYEPAFYATITYKTSKDYQGDIKLLYSDNGTYWYYPAIISSQQSYGDILKVDGIGYLIEKME